MKIKIIIIFTIVLSGCKKFVDVPPPYTQLVGESVFASNATASSAVSGIYATIVRNSIGGNTLGLSALLGLSADEFNLFPTLNVIAKQVYSNSLLSTTEITFWQDLYNCIYQANAAIEGISNSTGITTPLKQQLIGEAKFLRAFCFFYLINIYGDVPLTITTSYQTNSTVGRSSTTTVYDQIISDLMEAQSALSDDYRTPDGAVATQRVRPNKGAATALLARVFLYLGKWESAEIQSSAIISNSNYELSTDLNKVFLAANNKEAIWQLESPNNGFNAPDAAFLLGYRISPSSGFPFLLSDSLVNKFEAGDLRRANWVVSKKVSVKTYYFPYKYKLYFTGQPPTEYPMLFRLAEQYLIRSEARAQQDKLSGAISDLDIIRKRASVPLIANINPGINKQALLDSLINERRKELFTEYGHRWLDLKRSGRVGPVMSVVSAQKGGTWDSYKSLFPLPQTELNKNHNLEQNGGY